MHSAQVVLAENELGRTAPNRPQGSKTIDMSPRLSVIGRRGAERAEIETYIANKFYTNYGAKLQEFLPFLLVMRAGDDLAGVLGMRRADHGRALFLEQYMDRPAQLILGDLLASSVERDSLVEVGNLVSTWRGSSQMLFIALAALIVEVGAEWAVFTATPEVQKLLARLGVKQYVLGRADGGRLGEQLANWGSYYNSSPSLVAVNAAHALNIFARQPMSSMLLASCKHQIEASCTSNNIGALYD